MLKLFIIRNIICLLKVKKFLYALIAQPLITIKQLIEYLKQLKGFIIDNK